MSKGRLFNAPPRSAAQWHPFSAPAPLCKSGIPLGINLRTRRIVMFDPWMMKMLGILHSLMILVLGQKGFGKSTLLKTLAIRLAMLQAGQTSGIPNAMRIRMHDRRRETGFGENKLVMDYLWGENIVLNRAQSINLLDLSIGTNIWDILDIMVNACELASGRQLENHQPLALQVGVHKLLEHDPRLVSLELLENIIRNLKLIDIDEYYRASDNQLLASYNERFAGRPELLQQLGQSLNGKHHVVESEFQHDASLVAGYIGRILYGEYGRIFGGTRPLDQLLNHPVANWDWSGLTDKARQLLIAMQWKWQMIAHDNNRTDLIPHVNTGDEDHELMSSLMHVRYWAAYSAKARAFSTADFQATQYLSQISQAGAEGSEIRGLAGNILRGVGCYFLGHIGENDTDAEDAYSRLGVSDQDIDVLRQGNPGCFGILVPGHKLTYYQHVITPIEATLVQTNAANDAMVDRVPVLSDPGVLASWQAAAKNGYEYVGSLS